MPEQLGILLLFLVVVLFNLFGSYLTRRRERESARTEKAPLPPAPRIAPPPPPAARPHRQVDVPPPPPQRVRRVRWGPRDLRRAIVIMTVLGPPRGLIDEHRDVR